MKHLLAILAVILFLTSGNAQEQPSISLSDAIALSLQNNFQILITKANTEIASNNNSWGQAGLYPSLTFNVSNNNSLTDQDNPASFINGKYTNITYRGNVDLNWTLFNGFKVKITKEKLDLLEQQSNGNASIVVENTIQAVILAYNGALVEKNRLDIFGNVLKLSRDKFEYVQHKKEIGVATTFDLLQVKNAMLQDSGNFLSQQLNYKNALRNLNLLLAQDTEIKVILKDSIVPATAIYDPEAVKQKMLSANRTLKNQYINQELMKKEVDFQKSNIYPRLSINTGMNQSGNRFQLEDFPSRSGSSMDYYANFSLNFTLFSGGRFITAIENAKIQEKIAALSVGELELKMTNQLIILLDLYNTRQSLLAISLENVNSAKLNMELADEKFKNGTITSFEYRDIQLNYLNISQNNINAMYNLIDTNTELLRISGGILEIYGNGN